MTDALIIIAGILIGVLLSIWYSSVKLNKKLKDKLDEINWIMFNSNASLSLKKKVAKVLNR